MRLSRFRCARVIAAAAAALLGAAAFAQNETPPGDPALRDYLSGNGLLARGLNDLAAKEYRKFLEEHPTHERASSARYALAVALWREKHAEAALEQLDGLKAGPSFEFAVEAGVLRAQCLLSLDKPADAASELQRVLERSGSNGLGGDAAALLVEARYRAKAYKEVEAARAQLEQRWPESPRRDRAEYFAGLALLELNAPAEASARLSGVARQWPKSPLAGQATLLAAQCAQRAGGAAEATKLYEATIETGDPRLVPQALLNLASAHRAAGKPDAAKPLLDRLLTEFKDSDLASEAHLERGRTLFDAGEFGPARKDFDRYAASPKADSGTAEFWRARCEARQGKADAAAKRLTAAMEGSPAGELRPLMMLELASAHLATGDEGKAAEVLERFRAEFPDHPQRPDATESLATIRHRHADYEASGSLCSEFVSKYGSHPLRARVDFLVAENAFLSGDTKGAARAYESFLAAHRADANASLATFRLACAVYRNGDTAKARPLFVEAAAKARDSEALRPALLYLGDIAFQKGDWGGAEQPLREFLEFGGEQAGADDAVLKLGLSLHRQNREAEALAQYDRVLSGYPKSSHRGLAALERARSLQAMGKRDEAREQLQSIAAGKDVKLAAMALVQLGALASEAGAEDEAAKCFARAAEIGDDDTRPDALLGLASALGSRGAHQKAVDALDKLIGEFPKYARLDEARARRALSRAKLGPDAGALAELDRALAARDLRPEVREALMYERGACLRQLGRASEADEAMKALASGAQGAALKVSAALEVARGLSEAKKYAEAASVLHAVESEASQGGVPDDARENLEYQIAACEFRQDHAKEGAELFERFLERHPSSTLAGSASLLAGECRRQLKQPKRAATLLNKALEGKLSDDDRRTALLRLGECLADQQDWSASERTFGTYLDTYADSPLAFQARFGKGWAIENQGRHEDAIAEYQRVTASHQGPTAARAQFQIGECLFAQHKHEDAVRELLKVDILYAYPEWSAAALYEAGRCFEALGKPEDARTQFSAVKEKHPSTRWAQLAAERLGSLAKGGGASERPARARQPRPE